MEEWRSKGSGCFDELAVIHAKHFSNKAICWKERGSLLSRYDKVKHAYEQSGEPVRISNFSINIQKIARLVRSATKSKAIKYRNLHANSTPDSRAKSFDNKNKTHSRLENKVKADQLQTTEVNKRDKSDGIFPLEQQQKARKQLLNRESSLGRKISLHFSEFMMEEVKTRCAGILHSRDKKQCSYMKTVKVRGVMKGRKTPRKDSSCDNFTSIEVAQNSKYGSTKKIGNIGETGSAGCLAVLRKKLQQSLVEKGRNQPRKLKFSMGGREGDQYHPWQTQRMMEIFADDSYLMD